MEPKWEEVLAALSKGEIIPDHLQEAMRHLQARESLAASKKRLAGLAADIRRRGGNPDIGLVKRNGRTIFGSKGPTLFPSSAGQMPPPPQSPPLTCASNFSFVSEQGPPYTYGSSETEDVRPLPNEPSWAGGAVYSLSSVLTSKQTGEIALAGATGYEYWPDPDPIFPGAGVRVAASLTHLFDLPQLPGLNPAALQVTARVSVDHPMGGWLDPGKSSDDFSGMVGLFGFVTTTATLIPPSPSATLPGSKPQKSSNTHEFLNVIAHGDDGGRIRGLRGNLLGNPYVFDQNIVELDPDHPVDVTTNIRYANGVTKVLVDVNVEVDCFKFIGSGANCGCGIDERFLQTATILPDGATQKCPFLVETIRFCML